jgi:hypothetical protein
VQLLAPEADRPHVDAEIVKCNAGAIAYALAAASFYIRGTKVSETVFKTKFAHYSQLLEGETGFVGPFEIVAPALRLPQVRLLCRDPGALRLWTPRRSPLPSPARLHARPPDPARLPARLHAYVCLPTCRPAAPGPGTRPGPPARQLNAAPRGDPVCRAPRRWATPSSLGYRR